MKIQVYMTKNDFEEWREGREVTVNTIPSVMSSPNTLTQKMAVFVDEKDVISLEYAMYFNEHGVKVTHHIVTVKREKGPTASFL